MPTTKTPRKDKRKTIHLHLPADVHAELMALADALGVSATRFLASALAENLESFRELAALARAVEAGRAGAVELRSPVLQAAHQVAQATEDLAATA